MRIRVQPNGMQNKLEMDVEHDANADANTSDSHNHNNNRIVELWGEKNRLKIEILRIITRHSVFEQRLLYGLIMQVILF